MYVHVRSSKYCIAYGMYCTYIHTCSSELAKSEDLTIAASSIGCYGVAGCTGAHETARIIGAHLGTPIRVLTALVNV